VLQYTVFEQLKEFLRRPKGVEEVVGTEKAHKSFPKVLTAFQASLDGALAKTVLPQFFHIQPLGILSDALTDACK
jgi:hypothetical protein